MKPNETILRQYEQPEGIALETSHCTIFLNASPSRNGKGLVSWRLSKRLNALDDDGREKRFGVTFDLDADMTRVMAEKALKAAGGA